MNIFKTWMNAATATEQQQLADAIGTSRAYLYQISNENRGVGADRARDIERHTATMHRASRGRLPKLYRTDLHEGCRGCEFAARCLGADVVARADFPVLGTSEGAA